jgi:hypothetical protein
MVRSKIKIKKNKNQIDDSKIDFNYMNFEREFALKESNLKLAEKPAEKSKKKKTHLDGGLSTTFEFMLKKNPMAYEDILYNLMEYNLDYFNVNICTTLA